MRALIGNRLLKRFVGDIRQQPGFGLHRVSGSRPDNGEATTYPSEKTAEQAQTRTPERDDKTTDASASENGEKPATKTLESDRSERTA